MGWYGCTIGNYSITMHDSTFEYVKRSKPKEYYEKYMVNTYFRNGSAKEIEKDYPLTLFGEVVKLKKYYDFNPSHPIWTMLGKLLMNEIKARKLSLLGTVELTVYREKDYPTYFLTSEVRSEKMELNNIGGVLHCINSFEDYVWVEQKGLRFNQLKK